MTAGIIALSRHQVLALLEDELDGAGPCSVSESLPWSALARTSVVPGARVMMEALAGDGARLTPRGNLNRKLVELLIERSRWANQDVAELRSMSKVFNEHDFSPAMYLHAMLRMAGLARRKGEYLKLTRKGAQLLADEAAGPLQATLFRTTFTRYNLAYLDRWGEPDVYASQISLILFLIGRFCIDWHPADELMRSVTLPTDKPPEPPSRWIDPGRMETFAFTNRVLRYLCWFGLLEEAPRAANDWTSMRSFRKTQLYDEMLTFTLG